MYIGKEPPTTKDLGVEVAIQPPESIFQVIEQQELKEVDHYLDVNTSRDRKKITSQIEDRGIKVPFTAIRGLDIAQHRMIQRTLNAKLVNLATATGLPISDKSRGYENEDTETLLEHEKAHIEKAEELCQTTWDDMSIFIFATAGKKRIHLGFGAVTSGFANKPGYKALTRYQESLIDLAPREPAVSDYLYFSENFLASIDKITEAEVAGIIRILESKPQSIGKEEALRVVYQHKNQ